MKENVLDLANESKNLIDDFENYMYENFKEKYVNSKCVLDRNRENIEHIEDNIDEVDVDEATSELTNIIESIKEVKNSIENKNEEESIINNAAPEAYDENIIKEETVENAINNLDEAVENSSFTQPVEEVPEIENILTEEEIVSNANEEINNNIDENAIDAFLNENNLNIES